MSECAICGSKSSLGNGLCYFGCYWILEGWVGFNARERSNPGGTMYFANQSALKMWSFHRLSYPKMVRTARAMGWTGRENAKETMTEASRPKGLILIPAAEAVAAKNKFKEAEKKPVHIGKVALVQAGAVRPRIKFNTFPTNITPEAKQDIATVVKRFSSRQI
jgi:hypothetical protein